jgi:hypothetical protein
MRRANGLVPPCLAGCLLLTLALVFPQISSAQSPASASFPSVPTVFNGSIGTVPNAVAMGDFNGDGLLDFAVVEINPQSPASGQVEIFLGNKDGSFTSKTVIPIGTIGGQQFSTTHPIAVGNFNGPSPQALGIAVAVNSGPVCPTGGVVVLFGNGDGTFQSPVCLSDAPGVNGVVTGDFDGTGFDDIAAASASGAVTSFIVFQSNGASSFPKSSSFTSFAPGTSTLLNGVLYVGGYGNAKLPNLVLLASTGPFTQFVAPLQTSQVSGTEALTFINSGVVATDSNGFTDVGFADMNGDGVVDIVGISNDINLQYFPVTVGTGGPTGGLNVIGKLTGIGGPDGFALSIEDLNGNGFGDFASLNANRNLGITFDVPCFDTLNPLCASIKPSTIGPFGPEGQGIASGFSTGLGKWVVVDAGVFQVPNSSFEEITEARSIAVYLISATGQITLAPIFTQSSTTTTGTPPPAFAVADLDGDGAPDVAVLGENQATFAATVTPFQNVFKSNAAGFVAQTVFDLGAGEELSEPGLNPFAIAVGKFRNAAHNPSGLPDLALVLPDGITVLNNGGGFTFTANANCQGVSTSPASNCYLGNDPNFPGFAFSSPPRPAIIAADVNGDGNADMVLAIPENCNSFDSGGAKARIYVLVSNGDGTFQPAVSYPSPVVNPVALALGNILGTGSPDLVVTNGGEVCTGTQAATGAITNVGAALLPNLRDGSGFGSPATLAPQTIFSHASEVLFPDISAVAVADMNADGTPDVVISASDGVHVLVNKKTNPATFTDKGAVPLYGPDDAISNAAQIDIADFNGDGTPDVAAAIGGIIYVFTNDGTGVLTSPGQGFASGPNSGQVTAIDVNGDGVPDVLVSNSLGFSVLLDAAAAATPLVIATTSLPAGIVGTAYSQTLTATGGKKLFSWSVPPGALPPGLSLSAAGMITGTPTTAGTFSFTVTVTDSSSPVPSATAILSIQIAAPKPPVSIVTTSLPGGIVSTAYSQTLGATGGTTPYTWSVSTGALPPGLSLSAAGVITGTPSTAGTFNFNVKATDSSSPGQTATAPLSIQINPTKPPVSIITALLGPGTVGMAYSQTLAATGGTTPYTWSVPPGTLPPGLSLSTAGVITGTPTTAGTFDFTVKVSDSSSPAQTATASLSIQVTAATGPSPITIPTITEPIQTTDSLGSGSTLISATVIPTITEPIQTTDSLGSGSTLISATVIQPIREMVNVTDTPTIPPPVILHVTVGSKLGSIILDPTAGVQQYVATVALSNGGNIAGNIQVTGATLNGVSSTSVPISLTLGPAGSANVTLNFPSSAGASGTTVVFSIKGTYSASEPGGSSLNGSWTGEFRVTLPASTQ